MSKVTSALKKYGLQARKAAWATIHDHSPDARAIFVVGAQRSGTTLLLDCFEQSMRFQVLGEASEAMDNFRIKSNDHIRDRIQACRHPFIVFKPLTDSHRVMDLLSLGNGTAAIWAFRRVEDRVNSSVAKFGDHNLQILRGISVGEGLHRWQAQGLNDEQIAFIKGFDYECMSPHDASALFWYLRNSLYFNQALDLKSNVLPLAYEDLASDPKRVMQGICRFIGAAFDSAMVSNVHAKSIGRSEAKVSQEILALCTPLYEQLREIQRQRWQELQLSG